jgi:hypothetical protein
MSALLELEPRDAGTEFAEPEIEFEGTRNPLREMVMCLDGGFCLGSVLPTQAATQ